MASLYIKDSETADLVAKVAKRAGMTKTALVRDMAIERQAEMDRTEAGRRDQEPLLAVMERFWRKHPLGEPTGLEADKAFYDSLNDEEDD